MFIRQKNGESKATIKSCLEADEVTIYFRDMKILVTAGPTREFLDPVRFLSNRSTGKMGYAIVEHGMRMGHSIRLITGPVNIKTSCEDIIQVVTAQEMCDAVMKNVGWCDVLIMAAAVCDWRPRNRQDRKLKKHDMASQLELERTPDILSGAMRVKGQRIFVGFAAETHNLLEHAMEKLETKGLDMIVANDVSRQDSGFEVDTNRVILLDRTAGPSVLPLMTKKEVAARIMEWVEACGSGSQ